LPLADLPPADMGLAMRLLDQRGQTNFFDVEDLHLQHGGRAVRVLLGSTPGCALAALLVHFLGTWALLPPIVAAATMPWLRCSKY
jgi:hypothetical protein